MKPPDTIVVQDVNNLVVDGENVGALNDYLNNHVAKFADDAAGRKARKLLHDAMEAHVAGLHARHGDDLKGLKERHKAELDGQANAFAYATKSHGEAIEKLKADHQAALEKQATGHARVVKKHEDKHALAELGIARREQIIAALGGRAAYDLTRPRRRERAKEDLKRAEAALAAIEAEGDEAPAEDTT